MYGKLNYIFQSFIFCVKIVSLHSSGIPCYCNLKFFDKHQRTKNSLQIALRQQTELPHPLLRSSSSKTTTIVWKQRYTRIKCTCKAVQNIKSFGRGPYTPLWRPPLSFKCSKWLKSYRVNWKLMQGQIIKQQDHSGPVSLPWDTIANYMGMAAILTFKS